MRRTARSPFRRAFFLAVVATTALSSGPATVEAGDRVVGRPAANVIGAQSDDDQNRDVRVHNQTGWTMTGLYASSDGTWGDDLLESGTLSPGEGVVVTIDDGSGACRYALRAEFDNGQALQRAGINACQVADYYFTR